MDGDPITQYNEYMPVFPDKMPLWQRILCVLGYHKLESRKTAANHKFPNMPLRNQCGRCNKLL